MGICEGTEQEIEEVIYNLTEKQLYILLGLNSLLAVVTVGPTIYLLAMRKWEELPRFVLF